MAENNFENDVRKKLEALSLPPSAGVWQKVESRIKKRRRRVALWLLPVALVSAGVLVWIFSNKSQPALAYKQRPDAGAAAQTFSKPHTEPPGNAYRSSAPAAEPPVQKPADTLYHTNAFDRQQPVGAARPAAAKPSGSAHHQLASKKAMRTSHSKNTKVVFKQLLLPRRYRVKAARQNGTAPGNKHIDSAMPAGIKNGKLKPAPAQKNSAVFDTAVVKARIDSGSNSGTAMALPLPAARGWQWQVFVRSGTAGTSRVRLPGSEKSMRDASPTGVNNSPDAFENSGGTLNDTSQRIYLAAPTGGGYFSFGVSLTRPLGKNLLFKAGLSYASYVTHLQTGRSITNSSNTAFNRVIAPQMFRANSVSSSFTNRFRFLQLPVAFTYAVLKKKTLELSHGLALSRSIGGRSLQYDTAGKIYTTSHHDLRKTNVTLFAGAEYKFFASQKMVLSVGPHLEYGLLKLYGHEAAKTHLRAGGLSLTANF